MAQRPESARRIRALVRQFRRAALAVRIPFLRRLLYWTAYLGLARRGVMLHSETHDAVYQDGFWKRHYDQSLERINRRLAAAPATPPVDVPSFQHGELDLDDLHQLMAANIPFVIRGGAQVLPMHEWSLDYLERLAGDCAVPINEAADRPSTDTSTPTKSHHYYRFRTGTLAEVTAGIRAGKNMRITTAEDVMHHDGGRLRQDLDLPYWERVSGWDRNQRHWLRSRLMVGKIVGAQLLLQPQNAFTLWHSEPGDNFFVLARGTKTWTLAHPYYTAALRPRVKTTTNYHGCNIDIRESDDVQQQRGFAGYLGMPKVRVVMMPGDMLRVPNYWWHTVVTQPGDYTVAATIRSNSAPNWTGPGYTILRLLDRQFHELAKAYAKEGRIGDRHIGYPRPPRKADKSA
ncbi:MAG: cupin-like domain-containing protein [Planctomycetes bacterium]|nr:cupin-like domain-containing protein [Planctomycetota bacterium]